MPRPKQQNGAANFYCTAFGNRLNTRSYRRSKAPAALQIIASEIRTRGQTREQIGLAKRPKPKKMTAVQFCDEKSVRTYVGYAYTVLPLSIFVRTICQAAAVAIFGNCNCIPIS